MDPGKTCHVLGILPGKDANIVTAELRDEFIWAPGFSNVWVFSWTFSISRANRFFYLMESVVIGFSDANPQNVLIDTIQVAFVSCISIQNWFFPLAYPISTNGICIHLAAQVPPEGHSSFFPLFLCFTSNLLATPCQLTFKACYKSSFLKSSSSLTCISANPSKCSFCCHNVFYKNNHSGL